MFLWRFLQLPIKMGDIALAVRCVNQGLHHSVHVYAIAGRLGKLKLRPHLKDKREMVNGPLRAR